MYSKKRVCINPLTNRRIQIGGRPYLKLVKKGVIDDDLYRTTEPNDLPAEDLVDLEKTASLSMSIVDDVQKNRISMPQDMTREEAESYLQALIFNRMLTQGKPFLSSKKSKSMKRAKIKKKKKAKAEIRTKPSKRGRPVKLIKPEKQKLKPLKKIPKQIEESEDSSSEDTPAENASDSETSQIVSQGENSEEDSDEVEYVYQ